MATPTTYAVMLRRFNAQLSSQKDANCAVLTVLTTISGSLAVAAVTSSVDHNKVVTGTPGR
jgi:hypothetical protein